MLEWPYIEGLRLDEAMHPLTILAVGLYGEYLPNQNGAPIRLVVPWKYGFKSIKSIVRIRLTEREPMNSWQLSAPNEYGFYSNVNPERDHPRWSQARERRIGEFLMRPTLMFNGYGDQVASLYCRNGSEEILLKPLVFAAALVPFALLIWRGFNGDLSADPLVEITNETGIWTLRFVVITLAITPIRRVTGWNPVIRFRRMLGLFAFFYGMLHFLTYLIADRFASLDFPGRLRRLEHARESAGLDLGRCREAPVHHGRLHRVRLDDSAGADVDGRMDPPPRRPQLAAASPADLSDGHRRGHPLLVESESGYTASRHLRGDRRRAAGVSAGALDQAVAMAAAAVQARA